MSTGRTIETPTNNFPPLCSTSIQLQSSSKFNHTAMAKKNKQVSYTVSTLIMDA